MVHHLNLTGPNLPSFCVKGITRWQNKQNVTRKKSSSANNNKKGEQMLAAKQAQFYVSSVKLQICLE